MPLVAFLRCPQRVPIDVAAVREAILFAIEVEDGLPPQRSVSARLRSGDEEDFCGVGFCSCSISIFWAAGLLRDLNIPHLLGQQLWGFDGQA